MFYFVFVVVVAVAVEKNVSLALELWNTSAVSDPRTLNTTAPPTMTTA